MLVILYILNDDLHVHHVKHISTCSGWPYDMAHSIYIRPCTHITTCSGYHPTDVELATLQEPLPFEVAHAGRRWSSGPAGENMAANLSSVQTLNIRLLYKVVEYGKVHKCWCVCCYV